MSAVARAQALFNSANLDIPGHEVELPNPGTFGYGDNPQLNSSTWDTRGENGRFVPQIERFLNYGQPPSSSSHELETMPITMQFQVPELPDGSPTLLMPGMLVFSVTERGPDDLDTTVVLSLAKINQYARDQWLDFITYTSATPLTNPHFNFELRKFATSMRVYGENGLRSYHWARQNYHHDGVARKLLAQYDACDPRTKLSRWKTDTDPMDGTTTNFAEPLPLREYYERATQPGYCYLTLFGFMQRLRFLGVVLTVMKGTSLEDCMEEGAHTFELGVAVGKQVELPNCFGTDEEIGIGSRLWIQLTRVPCNTKDDIKFGAFQLCPRGSKINDYPRFRDIGYQDESGTMTSGFYWRVGVVIEPPQRAVEQSSITQANNTGMFTNPDMAFKLNALLPNMRIALGFRN